MIQSHRRAYPKVTIVFVGVCSAQRRDAFAACEFIMDALKSPAAHPIHIGAVLEERIDRRKVNLVEQKASKTLRAQKIGSRTVIL